jgi:hypothetical protein
MCSRFNHKTPLYGEALFFRYQFTKLSFGDKENAGYRAQIVSFQ